MTSCTTHAVGHFWPDLNGHQQQLQDMKNYNASRQVACF